MRLEQTKSYWIHAGRLSSWVPVDATRRSNQKENIKNAKISFLSPGGGGGGEESQVSIAFIIGRGW